MISQVSSCGVHAANLAAKRNSRANKSEATQTSETSAPREKNTPPGLARAAEKIAAKIFSRADADGNGTITQEELSAVHSRHARNLAASDLFQTTAPETPDDPNNQRTTDTPTTTEPATQSGVTEAQLKEALTKFFYAKVGITYTPSTPPTPPVTEPPTPTDTIDTATPPADISPPEAPQPEAFEATA